MILNVPPPAVKNFKTSDGRPKKLEIPKLHTDIRQVRRYLMKRGIDERIIEYCHRDGSLFEDWEYHNCVFIGRDKNGVPRFGSVRSTVTDFKRDLDGSDKRYYFKTFPGSSADTVHLFESAIDLMSYITLALKSQVEWRGDDYISLDGVYASDNERDIPLALNAYLEDHPNVKRLNIHFDNDEIGRMSAEQITKALHNKYEVINSPPESGKDYNDYLQNESRKRKEPER